MTGDLAHEMDEADLNPSTPSRQEGVILPPSWQYREAAARLLDNGYSPLPIRPGTKAVLLTGWQLLGTRRPSLKTVAGWSRKFGGWGIGAAAGDLVGIDIDLLDPDQADRTRRSALQAFGDTPLQRIGQAPKSMLFYRTASPFPSFDVGKVQIIASGRQAVLFAVHPDTGRLYTWIEDTPLDVPLLELPVITEEAIRQWAGARTQEGGETAPHWPGARIARDGERGITLFAVATSAARSAPDYEAVLAAVREFNAAKCMPPTEDSRVITAAKSAWKYRTTGRLYPANGQQWGAVSAIELLDLSGYPAALCLLIMLRQAHGLRPASGVLVSPIGIEKSGRLGRFDKKRIRTARAVLIEKGYLVLEEQGTGEGHPSKFRLTGPKLGEPGEGGKIPLYVIEQPPGVSLLDEEQESSEFESVDQPSEPITAADNSAGLPVETISDPLQSTEQESESGVFPKLALAGRVKTVDRPPDVAPIVVFKRVRHEKQDPPNNSAQIGFECMLGGLAPQNPIAELRHHLDSHLAKAPHGEHGRIAAALGVTPSTLSNWKANRDRLNPNAIRMLQQILGVMS
jgi:Bifunctional DNA primase/polymerase, N-terminal